MDCKLSYCDALSSGVAASSYVSWQYQSSLFDPYASVGGHQPLFFDQYAAMYRRYLVYGIAYNVDAIIDSATQGALFLTVEANSQSGVTTSLSSVRERAGTKETCVGQGYKAHLKGYFSCAKLMGVSRRKLMTDDQYSAFVTTDPVQRIYLNIQLWNISATAAISTHTSMRLTYYCRFFDPQEVAQS